MPKCQPDFSHLQSIVLQYNTILYNTIHPRLLMSIVASMSPQRLSPQREPQCQCRRAIFVALITLLHLRIRRTSGCGPRPGRHKDTLRCLEKALQTLILAVFSPPPGCRYYACDDVYRLMLCHALREWSYCSYPRTLKFPAARPTQRSWGDGRQRKEGRPIICGTRLDEPSETDAPPTPHVMIECARYTVRRAP